jgi:hypothetical protein
VKVFGVLSAAGWGPGFSAPRLLRIFFGGKCGAEKGGINDLGKSCKAF